MTPGRIAFHVLRGLLIAVALVFLILGLSTLSGCTTAPVAEPSPPDDSMPLVCRRLDTLLDFPQACRP